jgi:hypothetical protein
MTATTTPSSTHYQDIHSTTPLTPTRCHPTAHSHRHPAHADQRVAAAAHPRAAASVGVSTFRVCEMRPDWAPSISRGGGVLPGGMQIRPAPAAFQRPTLHPAVASHRQGFSSRDVIEGSRVFARPVFPLPVATGWNGGAWASPRSFTPRRYQRRTSRWERIIGHEPGITLSSATSPTPSPKAATQHTRPRVAPSRRKCLPPATIKPLDKVHRPSSGRHFHVSGQHPDQPQPKRRG